LFQPEVLVAGAFNCSLTLRNAQLWQIGLLGFCLSELQGGFLLSGFRQAPRLGPLQKFKDRFVGRGDGVGQREGGGGGGAVWRGARRSYNLMDTDAVPHPAGTELIADPLSRRFKFSGKPFEHLVSSIMEGPWRTMSNHPIR